MNEESLSSNQCSPLDQNDQSNSGDDNLQTMNSSDQQIDDQLNKSVENTIHDSNTKESILDDERRSTDDENNASNSNETANLHRVVSKSSDVHEIAAQSLQDEEISDDDQLNRMSFDDKATTHTDLDMNKSNLNDDISEDDANFEKDDELDFEECDNSRSTGQQEQAQAQKLRKKATEEDGEVNSEEELEDGEVKEEDSDDDTDQQADSSSRYSSNDPNKLTPANLNSLCRFYSKGQCTWGSSCRFVHQKPMGTTGSYSPKPIISQPINSPISKPVNESSTNNYPQPSYSKTLPPPPPSNNNSGSYYHSSTINDQSQYRSYGKKDYPQSYSHSKSYNSRSEDLDYNYDAQYGLPYRTRYDERASTSSSNYSRHNVSSASNNNYYTSNKPHQSSSAPVSHNNQSSSSSGGQRGSVSNYESEYERKRRLAFESAPWNDSHNDPTHTSPQARDSPIDRHSQSSGSKIHTKQHPPVSSNYVKKNDLSSAEHYRDPWRRSKSPQLTPNYYSGSRDGSNRGTPHHHPPSTSMYMKSKSDSGSNFSNSDAELMDHTTASRDIAKSRRLDPEYANKHRPSSFRESSNGESTMYDNDHSTSNKKPYYKQSSHTDELDNNQEASFHHNHSTSSTPAYPKSSANTAVDMEIPNYERPKNLPLRTRKDSWSDSDSCSSSSNTSYSGTGASETDSNSDPDKPYSRTNKFESTREVDREPQLKRQRTISDNNSRLSSSSKHELSNKAPRSPYSPTNEFSKSSRYSSTSSRKKHSVLNCEDDLRRPSYLDEDVTGLESRSIQKKSKTNRADLNERNGLTIEHRHPNNASTTFETMNSHSTATSSQDKAELLAQLQAIEEAISKKRSKLK